MPDPTTITNVASLAIKTLDQVSGDVIISRDNGDLAVLGIVGQYTQRFKLLGGSLDTPIPITFSTSASQPLDQLYIKNVDANAIVIVKWKVGGAGAVTACQLQPGAILLMWSPVVSGGTGINSVTCASSIGSTYIEVFEGIISS